METLTFLNTDIEGSTTMLRRVGDQTYATILGEHHRIIREQLTAHGGKEEGTAGDSFFAVFTSPSSCVNAVIAMQLAFESFAWPEDERVRVRMGIHTGEVSQNDTGFVGYEVHRAARISAIGHGGQILLSSSTASLIEGSLTEGTSVRSLGSHRLKDLGRPESIFQLIVNGLPSDFAPLRSLDNPEYPNNLPTSLNDFIGRQSDLEEVRTLAGESRLVTLTGAGGSGKTRLALQVAAGLLDHSRDGVWFVELAPVNDPAQVPVAVMSAMALSEDGELSGVDVLISALKDQSTLLVIDNCEHVVDSVADLIDAILRQCPKVRLIATSREPLGVSGEEVYRVRSLSVPEADVQSSEELAGSDSAALFIQRGHSIDKSFGATDANAALIASICRRLDGIPLAIELAAARLSSMSIEDLHERLDQRFRLLTGGSRNALPRQQTLGAMVAWSYDLLNENEKAVLRRLTVFVSGFDLKAAEAVCSTETIDEFDIADILGTLVNKSLVIADRVDNTLRYRLLETIRQYAADQLIQVGGEAQMTEARTRHAHFHLKLAEQLHPKLTSHGQGEALKRLDMERGNIEAAFNTFSVNREDSEFVVRLARAIAPYARMRRVRDAIPFVMEVIDKTPADQEAAYANAMVALSQLLEGFDSFMKDGGFPTLSQDLQKALATVRASGLKREEAELCLALDMYYIFNHDQVRPEPYVERALAIATELGDKNLQATALLQQVESLGREEEKLDNEEVLRLQKETGNIFGVSQALFIIALRMSSEEDDAPRRHVQLLTQALELAESIDGLSMVDMCLNHLGLWLAVLGEWDECERVVRRSVATSIRLGRGPGILAWAALYSGVVSCAWGNYERATKLSAYCLNIYPLNVENPVGYLVDRFEREMADRTVGTCRSELGDTRFEELWAEGIAMTFDQSIALLKTPTRQK